MSTYHDREKAGKIPSFKHRTPNWHLQLALGEKRAARYKHMIGYYARTSTNIETLADLCYAPLAATYPTLSQVRLNFRLMRLYQQRLRLYCMKAGLQTGEFHTVRIYSLYSADRPSRAKPARTRRRFVAGRTLIWHLHSALGKREYLRVRAAWQDLHPKQSWAKYCSTYAGSYYRFGINNRFSPRTAKKWDDYGKYFIGDSYVRPT